MVLKQGAEQQQISLSFRLEGLKESEMNAKCKQQYSLSAGALLLASIPSIQVDKKKKKKKNYQNNENF